jgi:hypothetical protein
MVRVRTGTSSRCLQSGCAFAGGRKEGTIDGVTRLSFQVKRFMKQQVGNHGGNAAHLPERRSRLRKTGRRRSWLLQAPAHSLATPNATGLLEDTPHGSHGWGACLLVRSPSSRSVSSRRCHRRRPTPSTTRSATRPASASQRSTRCTSDAISVPVRARAGSRGGERLSARCR